MLLNLFSKVPISRMIELEDLLAKSDCAQEIKVNNKHEQEFIGRAKAFRYRAVIEMLSMYNNAPVRMDELKFVNELAAVNKMTSDEILLRIREVKRMECYKRKCNKSRQNKEDKE